MKSTLGVEWLVPLADILEVENFMSYMVLTSQNVDRMHPGAFNFIINIRQLHGTEAMNQLWGS
jgi:hypothetical protein